MPCNEPAADNAGGFRRLAVTKPANDKGKANIKQVNTALRLQGGALGTINGS